MPRKPQRKTIEDAFLGLSVKEAEALLTKYNEKHKKKIRVKAPSTSEMEAKILNAYSPFVCIQCGSTHIVKNGQTPGTKLQKYRCKECGRSFNILSDTFMDKSTIPWDVWVYVLQQMLNYISIDEIHNMLIRDGIVDSIDRSTVSIITKKLRYMFIHMNERKLTGVIQIDEKHFRESQKGFDDPYDVLEKNKRRTGRKRATSSKYGTMGPEFSTICCMVDDSGHSYSKVVCMGRMTLEIFEDEMASHIEKPVFICTDMNPIYGQYCALKNIPQYCVHSQYHANIKKCKTDKQLQSAYEQDKLDYIVGKGVLTYKQMQKVKKQYGLTINRVNAFHSELERIINRIAKGVSTKHLQSWISFYDFVNNWTIDNGHRPTSYSDCEKILIEMIKLRKDFDIDDIKTMKDLTRKVPARYTKKLITWTVNARAKSNNPAALLSADEGIASLNPKIFIEALPEYKRRLLAKSLGIKPFSPVAVSSKELKKKLLAHPDLMDGIYKMIGTKF